jgi:hypothetical protein
MSEIELHLFEIDSFEMASGDDARGEQQRGAVLERIEEIVLTRKNHGQMGLGVGIELTEGSLCDRQRGFTAIRTRPKIQPRNARAIFQTMPGPPIV